MPSSWASSEPNGDVSGAREGSAGDWVVMTPGVGRSPARSSPSVPKGENASLLVGSLSRGAIAPTSTRRSRRRLVGDVQLFEQGTDDGEGLGGAGDDPAALAVALGEQPDPYLRALAPGTDHDDSPRVGRHVDQAGRPVPPDRQPRVHPLTPRRRGPTIVKGT